MSFCLGRHKIVKMSLLKQLYDAEELPYDKFLKSGPSSLTDVELLAIMLRTGTRDKTPIELGRAVLQLSDCKWGLLGLHHFSIKDLMQIPGIGEVKAVQLLCIAEIAKRISNMQAKENLSFQNPDSVAAYYMERMRHQETERLILILLDSKSRMISDDVISVGILNATLISTREIFVKALKEEAAYVMILHNHPSGDPTPSRQDQIITNKIKEVSVLVDIPLIDHIIIGDNRYISFKQKGLL